MWVGNFPTWIGPFCWRLGSVPALLLWLAGQWLGCGLGNCWPNQMGPLLVASTGESDWELKWMLCLFSMHRRLSCCCLRLFLFLLPRSVPPPCRTGSCLNLKREVGLNCDQYYRLHTVWFILDDIFSGLRTRSMNNAPKQLIFKTSPVQYFLADLN